MTTHSIHFPKRFSHAKPVLPGAKHHAELVKHDRFAAIKADYQANGPGRSNLRYGYVSRPA